LSPSEGPILVIAPHADDEVLGCGGLIAKRVAQGHAVHVVVCGMGWGDYRTTQADLPTRQAELSAAAAVLGVATTQVLYPGGDMRLDTLPRVELVSRFDAVLAERPYAEIYLPCVSVNNDHRVVYEAMLSALRPTVVRPALRRVCAYEYALSGWPHATSDGGNYYVSIAETLDAKLKALACYASQLKPYPHPCSRGAVVALAHYRGLESGMIAAEMFYILREVEYAT
jgi:LmbE family N-acetylglucosaminyl deacetylase